MVSRARLALLLSALLSSCSSRKPPPAPPPVVQTRPSELEQTPQAAPPEQSELETRREPVEEVIFGQTIEDPYRWLEDAEAPEVKAWMTAQDRRTREDLVRHEARPAIAERVRSLLYVDTISAPIHRGNRWFSERKAKDREKSLLLVRDGKKGAERVLVDPILLAPQGNLTLGTWSPSWDGKQLAYALRENNADEATLYVLDVATGESSLIDVIDGAKYAYPSWLGDGSGFYYTWLPTDPAIPVSERPGYAEVRFHRVGTDPKSDEIVFERLGDPTKIPWAHVSRDGRYLFLTIWRGWSENDVFLQNLEVPAKERKFHPIAVGKPWRYSVTYHARRLFVLTNEDAPRWRVFSVDPRKLEREAWREVIPEDPSAVLKDLAIVGGRFGLHYLENASSRLRIHELTGKKVRDLELPAIGKASGFVGLPEDDEAYFGFSSFTHPPELHATSMRSGKTTLYDRVELPLDPERFVVEQVWYPPKDGVRISMFLVRRKDLPRDGTRPLLLTGYGGFNVSKLPEFNAAIVPWLERGGIFALPNLRGGGEYGEAWHRAGMRENKQNVFDDFIAAAEWLIAEGWTRRETLAISGRSNGGLLVGAAMTQRPDLFGAVICTVPLLDMLRYHLFGSGKTWIPEYGDPSVEEDFRFLAAYSPYQRIRSGVAYPPLLMMSSDGDDRVDPLHARKFLAAIQHASSAPGPYFLRLEMGAGHAGADLRSAEVERIADETVFLLETVGQSLEAVAASR